MEEEETEEERQAKGEKIADLMSQLTTEQISEAMDSVFTEMLSDFKVRTKKNKFYLTRSCNCPSKTK